MPYDWSTETAPCSNCGRTASRSYYYGKADVEEGCFSCGSDDYHCYQCCPIYHKELRSERAMSAGKGVMKVTKDTFIVVNEAGVTITTVEDVEAAKKAAAEAVTRTDRAYGKVCFVLKPAFKVEMPAPPAEITNL